TIPLEDLFIKDQPENREKQASQSNQSMIGKLIRSAGELLGTAFVGGNFGAAYGIGVGVLGVVITGNKEIAFGGILSLSVAGVIGGGILGAVLSIAVVLKRRVNPALPAWVELGLLPWRSYFLSLGAARQKYLGE